MPEIQPGNIEAIYDWMKGEKHGLAKFLREKRTIWIEAYPIHHAQIAQRAGMIQCDDGGVLGANITSEDRFLMVMGLPSTVLVPGTEQERDITFTVLREIAQGSSVDIYDDRI